MLVAFLLVNAPNCHLSLVLASVVQGDAVNCNIRQNVSIPFAWQQASLQKFGPLKLLIGSCADLNVDSGSDLKYWLRLLS